MTPDDELAAMEAHEAEVNAAFQKLERQRADLTAKNTKLRADIAKLTAERDADRAEVVQLCQERLQLKTERDEARDLLRSAIAAEEQLRQQREAESAAYDLLEDERNDAKAAVKRLTAKLEQANRGGAELGKTINYLAEVMRLAAVTLTDHGPVAGMHVLFNHMAEAETLTEDEHAKAWAALQAYEAAEKRTADERAEQTRRELRDSPNGSGT